MHSIFSTKSIYLTKRLKLINTHVIFAYSELREPNPEQRLKTAQLSKATSRQNSTVVEISRTTQHTVDFFSRWENQSSGNVNHIGRTLHFLAQCSFYYNPFWVSLHSWCLIFLTLLLSSHDKILFLCKSSYCLHCRMNYLYSGLCWSSGIHIKVYL